MRPKRPNVYQLLRNGSKPFAAFVRIAAALALVLTSIAPVAASTADASDAKPTSQEEMPTTFTVRIENISGDTDLPGPFAPGVWAVNDASVHPFFDLDTPDRGDGLAGLAEDGAAGGLAAAVAGQTGIHSSGVFNTPAGASDPGPLFPGNAYEFEVTANPGDYLSFASMLVQTNDIFVGPDANGIALFERNGRPRSGDITDENPFWDAGSEMNEAPFLGPNQAPRQRAADTGPTEGGVSAFGNTTRSLPLPGHIIDVDISENNGEFTFTIHNISGNAGAIDTPVAPIFYATHNDQWSLFTTGEAASAGLEVLAEDGSPAGLVGEHNGATGTGMVGAQPITNERPGDPPGPSFTGESYTFSVTPTATYPYVTIAAMVVQTNDVFLAFGADGLKLLDADGNPRAIGDIHRDFNRTMAIWDAGTEANEVPGVGPNQAPRQAAGNTGPADPISGVRLYNDHTNDLDTDPTDDLDGLAAGGFGTIVVTNGANPGEFDAVLTNTSDTTVYPGVLTPVAYAVHGSDVQLFTPGEAASEGLERLAEDGNFQPLVDALTGAAGVLSVGAQPVADGATDPGPIGPGGSYSFSFTADAINRYLSIASMMVPSNDTFFAFEPAGLRVMNADGSLRTNEDIAADIAGQRLAWDAGTERNQAGAAGPDQAPRQAGANTGADEGPATVRLLNDPVWDYPEPSDVVKITLTPQMMEEEPLPVDPSYPVTTFRVRVENISGNSDLPGPFSPGAYAVHSNSRPFFSLNKPDRGLGLAAIAEDGNAGPLGTALQTTDGVAHSGIFNRPVGATAPGPIFPGQAYEFEFTTTSDAARLSLATMLVQTNDIFAGPGPTGIKLFDADGNPISGDITELLPLWDVGSEMNEAPFMGPNQAPRQSGPDTGPAEGGVSAFSNTTRGLPLAGGIVDVTVTENNGEFTVTVHNISGNAGALDTPVAPIFYATHSPAWSLFAIGEDASAGLEVLAEDGSPAALVGEHTGATGTGMVGAQPITNERPSDPPGPSFTGESYTFSVTPTAAYPYLTFAGMVVQTNDVFLAPDAEGIALLDSDGNPRSTDAIMADISRMLAIWDAGTEANEVPGVGANQAPRQAGGNTGPADPISGVRFYSDATNDLAGENAGGFGTIVVTNGATAGEFNVVLTNTSDQTVYPGILTPVAYAVHARSVQLFEPGEYATEGLERLSEDGNFQPLVDELTGAMGVLSAGAQPVKDGATEGGPLMPGDSYSFSITADAAHRYLSVASMMVPSNDTFFAFEPAGLRVMNMDGTARSNEEIADDIASQRLAWDAGTERNQAGAGGPDQAPRQAGPNTGADEGPGTVRLIGDEAVWDYPTVEEVLKVTIHPVVDEEGDFIYLSTQQWGEVDGISFTDEDILSYNTATGEWAKFFDASDVGLWWNDLDAFAFMDDGSILMSFSTPRRFAGYWIDDSDIIRFIPESLGSDTKGTFEYYFDGSDVGLRDRFEDIDAIHALSDGRLAISTLGPFAVPGIQGRDEDVIIIEPRSLGRRTRGRWSRHFDGSDVKLRALREDVKGTWIDEASDDIFLTTLGNFSVDGASGDGADIIKFTPSRLGAFTQGTFAPFFDGSAHGLDGMSIDAFAIGGTVAVSVNSTAEESVAATAAMVDDDPPLGQDEGYDAPEENAVVVEAADEDATDDEHNVDDAADGSNATEVIIVLPFINN